VTMTMAPDTPDAPAPPLLEVEGLTRRFGTLAALDDLSLAVGRGEWVAVTGPSG